MNRCSPRLLISLLTLAASLGAALPSQAQSTAVSAPKIGVRNFPANVQYGDLVLGAPPVAHINDQALRTAPGFRLFSADNKLIFAHTVKGQKLRVAYVIEASTQWLLTAWILTHEEQKLEPR